MNRGNFQKIKNILEFAYDNPHSDFYRKKYKKAGFNPLTDFKSIKDVEKIPFLTKKELLDADLSQLLFVKEKDVLCIKSTSGTTGRPLHLFCSKFDRLRDEAAPHYPPFYTQTKFLGKGLVFSNAFNFNFINTVTEPLFAWTLTGDIHNLPATAQMADTFRINTIFVPPTLAIVFKNYIENCPNLKKSLKYLFLGGELVDAKRKKAIQKLYPGVTIFLGYGGAETGALAYQCKTLAKMKGQICYHHDPNLNHIEIINSDTEKQVKEDERGQLVITCLYFHGTPIIRYKTGDLVSIKKEKRCSCGFSSHYLQVSGRVNYDFVKVGGFELRKEFPEKIIGNFQNVLKDNFEIHIYEKYENNMPKIKLELNLSLKKGVYGTDVLKQKIEYAMLENWQVSSKLKLKKAVQAGIFEPIKINFVNFPISHKEKKVLILHQP